MRRLLLIMLFCLCPLSAQAACAAGVCDVGAGKTYTVMATAFAVLANGDTIESYGGVGGYSESNQSLTPPAGVVNVTWRHYEDDYTFDGTGATAVFFALAATNTGWDIDTQSDAGRVIVTGYIGAQPLVVTGVNNTVGGVRMTANGAAGVAQITAVLIGNGGVFQDILVDHPIDSGNQHWYGFYLNGGSGLILQDCTVEDATITGAKSAYGVLSAVDTPAPTIRRVTVRRITSASVVYGIYAGGANGYIAIGNTALYDLTAAATVYGIYTTNRTVIIDNVEVFGMGAPTARGINIEGAQVDAGAPDSYIDNCTVVGGTSGFRFNQVPAAGGRHVRNCVSSGGTVEFDSTGAGAVTTSLYNCAAGGLYSATFPNGATDLSTDPLFAAPGSDDYRLSSSSPCVDTGAWITGRTADIIGQPISGAGQDRGCYEFRQTNQRPIRASITTSPETAARDERSGR